MSAAKYAEVILPLAVGKSFSYYIPPEFEGEIMPGVRVEVNFGKKKHYAGIVLNVHQKDPGHGAVKPILAVLDDYPVVNVIQLKLWEWLSEYYMHHLGEFMSAALPPAMKLSSETRVVAASVFLDIDEDELSNDAFRIRETLKLKQEMGLDEVYDMVQNKNPRKIVRNMIEQGWLLIFEQLERVVEEKKKEIIRLDDEVMDSQVEQTRWFEALSRSKHQTNALMGLLFLGKKQGYVFWDELRNRFDIPRSAIKQLEKKGLIQLSHMGLSDLIEQQSAQVQTDLSPEQQEIFNQIEDQWKEKEVVLLQGVTGSGKTHIYAKKIKQILEQDPSAQVLFLLPEIALTTVTLVRLKALFGDDVLVYHSRLTPKERLTSWHKVLKGQNIVLGPRSALFLPFANLKLVIVDEEHDPSYRQDIRKPYYHGRDAAIMLAAFHKARVILGSATPSVTSLWKARQGKFGFARLTSRYGNVELPTIELVNLKESRRKKEMNGHFSKTVIDAMKEVLAAGKQVLLFQNRRGHSPIYYCPVCDWKAMCVNCDIALTYHKHFNKLVCHLCNYNFPFVEECPSCGSRKLEKIGLGTERIEEEVKELFPSTAVARLDFDTGSRKNAVEGILEDFQNNKTRILVGTQMIAKGVDFEHIGLVGILMADAMLYFPEYAAAERAFQLMLQVAGRAGRRKEQGKVLIQTYNPAHPVFKDLAQHNYDSFVKKEWKERKKYLYPPFCRMILIVMRHKDPKFVHHSAVQFGKVLRSRFGQFLIGPSEPSIARVRNLYIRQMMVKMPPDKEVIQASKEFLVKEKEIFLSQKGMSSLRLDMVVDP